MGEVHNGDGCGYHYEGNEKDDFCLKRGKHGRFFLQLSMVSSESQLR
jgi:hypothetical protein